MSVTSPPDPPLAGQPAMTIRRLTRDLGRAGRRDHAVATGITVLLWVMAIAYAAFFLYLSWWRYHTFLPHSEDLGNMEQAAWNTAHGYLNPPFQFNISREESLHFSAGGGIANLIHKHHGAKILT